MAFGTKYRFRFVSTNGAEYRILIQQDGYSSTIKDRALGRAPVLKRKHSGHVYGTSLEIYAECKVDGEFAELYTSDPAEFRVRVYKGDDDLVWTGFVTPELYKEPDIAPPYDVQIVATDGLGELKLHDFESQGDKTLSALFTYLLGKTSVSAGISFISQLSAKDSSGNSISSGDLWNNALINVDHMVGKSCYNVLQYLLTTLCASITLGGVWYIWRDNDATSQYLPYRTVGRMGSGSSVMWPIGKLSSSVQPAKNSVTVEAPFHSRSPLANPDMSSDYGWTKSVKTVYNQLHQAYYYEDLNRGTCISQTLTIDMSVGLHVVARCATYKEQSHDERLLQLTFRPVGAGSTYFTLFDAEGGGYEWLDPTQQTYYMRQNKQHVIITEGAGMEPAETGVDIPPFAVQGYATAGTLEIAFVGDLSEFFSGCFLSRPILKGYKDVLVIDNGARGAGDTVEIAHGRVTQDMQAPYWGYLQAVFNSNGRFLVSFADRSFTTYVDLLALTAKNYARLIALPRVQISGRLNTPADMLALPVLLYKGGYYYLLETLSWDLLNDEMDVNALSLPQGTLSVDSETVTGMTTGNADNSSGTGGVPGSGGTRVTWGEETQANYSPLNIDGDSRQVAMLNHKHTANNFTQGQWDAITSGLDGDDKTKLEELPDSVELETMLNGKMAIDQDNPVSRNITPASDVTYHLGSSAKAWRNLYIKRIYLDVPAGVSTQPYIEIDSDGAAHLYGADLVVENGDVASAGPPSQS